MINPKNNIDIEGISFKELIDIEEWQTIQDNFSIVTGVRLRTLDPQGYLIGRVSGECKLCTDLLKDARLKNTVCSGCLPTFLGGKASVDKNLSFACHMVKLGVSNFIVPFSLQHRRILAYIIAGPIILIRRRVKDEYKYVAQELGIDLEELWSALLQLRAISFQGIQSLLELLREIGEYTINLALQGIIAEKEKIMAKNFAKMSRLFDTVLDVAFEITKANIGSIMLLDKNKEELTIHSAKGLPDQITRCARVKLGERISGIVAKEGESFIIDDESADLRIRPYLNRPQIGSSMVLPLKIENEILGVINLGAYRNSGVKFTGANLNLVQKLLDLISLAIHQ